MFNLKALMTRALLALALALTLGAGAAFAGPTYRVAIDTTTITGTSGFLDLQFNGPGTAAPAIATLTNFVGNFGAWSQLEGEASGNVSGGIVLGNSTGFNAFLQSIAFGGLFSFDVRFDVTGGGDGTTFGVGLLDQAYGYLGANGNIAQIELQPGAADVLLPVAGFSTITEVSAVPEPSAWLLLATGLVLLGFTLRQRAAG